MRAVSSSWDRLRHSNDPCGSRQPRPAPWRRHFRSAGFDAHAALTERLMSAASEEFSIDDLAQRVRSADPVPAETVYEMLASATVHHDIVAITYQRLGETATGATGDRATDLLQRPGGLVRLGVLPECRGRTDVPAGPDRVGRADGSCLRAPWRDRRTDLLQRGGAAGRAARLPRCLRDTRNATGRDPRGWTARTRMARSLLTYPTPGPPGSPARSARGSGPCVSNRRPRSRDAVAATASRIAEELRSA